MCNIQVVRSTGVKSEGVYVSLVRSHLEPHQQLTRAAQLTFDCKYMIY